MKFFKWQLLEDYAPLQQLTDVQAEPLVRYRSFPSILEEAPVWGLLQQFLNVQYSVPISVKTSFLVEVCA